MNAGRHRAASGSTEAWTDERLDALTALWLGGVSATRIAGELGGISRSAVLGKVHRLGLGRPAAPAQPRAPKVPKPRKSKARAARAAPLAVAVDTSHMRREVPRLTRPVRTLIVAANGNIYVAPPPTPLPPLRMVEADNPRPLLQLGPHDCRHPVNDGDDPRHGWLYCSEAVTGPGEYCARCRTILFDHERMAAGAAKAALSSSSRSHGVRR